MTLPGFPRSTVAGHGGTIRSLDADGIPVLAYFGRVHGYEGNPVSAVVHNVRTAASAGCRSIILTNAAGSLREEWAPGQPVLIADHLNLTGVSPLAGPEAPEPYGPRFCDLTDAWSPRLRAVAHELAPDLPEGVYAGLNGPQYETPAEIRMLRTMGPTSSACQPCWSASPPATPASRCWACPWSPTWPPASPRPPSTTRRSSPPAAPPANASATSSPNSSAGSDPRTSGVE